MIYGINNVLLYNTNKYCVSRNICCWVAGKTAGCSAFCYAFHTTTGCSICRRVRKIAKTD